MPSKGDLSFPHHGISLYHHKKIEKRI